MSGSRATIEKVLAGRSGSPPAGEAAPVAALEDWSPGAVGALPHAARSATGGLAVAAGAARSADGRHAALQRAAAAIGRVGCARGASGAHDSLG